MKMIIITLLVAFCLNTSAQTIDEEQVAIGNLKGTLTTPVKKTKKAVLMISGSGPTDRDGNSALGFINNGLKMVSEELTIAGYAVLRYDKRGIASSKEMVSNPSEQVFDDFVADAKDWVNFLSERGYSKIIIAGHSQGSLVGMLAAQQSENVVGFVSIAGLAEDAGTAIVRQLKSQSIEMAEGAQIKIDSIRMGYEVTRYNPLLISLFGPHIQGFLKSYIRYTPVDEIKKLNIPVLIINGTTDMQVGVDQAKALKEAYPAAELAIIENMNHVLKNVPDENPQANMATYSNPELPLSEGLITSITSFIKKL